MARDAPPPADTSGAWAILREAVRGTTRDLTAISLRRAVVLLAVPTVLEMSMESLFAVVDIFFVSKLGSAAVAVVGLTESMLALVYALAMGLGAGATAVIAKRSGEKDAEGAATAAVQVILAALVAATIIGVAGAILAPALLAAMGAGDAVIAIGTGYTSIMLGGSITIFLLFVVNAVFRSAGDASVAMRSLWLASALNMVLAPCLIFGLAGLPRLGVTGAAVATTLSRGAGVVYQLVVLLRGSSRLAIARRHLAVRVRELAEIVRLAVPATMQVLVETMSWLALVRILAGYGSTALAGYTIAMRIALFVLLPPFGLANAAATLVGQNLGARKLARARESVGLIARYNVTFLGTIGLVLLVLARPLVSLFTPDEPVVAVAAMALRIIALGFAFFAYGMVAIQAFNGAGDTRTPMLLNVASFWLFKIPLAYALARVVGMGPMGVFVAISAAYSLQSVLANALFRRGGWARSPIA